MSRPSYALATRTKDKLGVVGQLVDGATRVVVTATCRPRDWLIFICGTQLDVRSTNSFSDGWSYTHGSVFIIVLV